MNSLCFFSLVDCRLAAEIADFGRNGPNVGQPALRRRFRCGDGQFSPEKNPVGERDDKLDGDFTRFYITTVYKS